MSKFVLYLYDVLGRHRLVRWTSLVATTVVLLVLMSGQTYREDIADFLPLSDGQEETFREYLESSGAQCVFVIFSDTAGNYEEATDLYCDLLDEEDTIHHADYVIANETTVVVESPYGANETARNGRLVEMLEAIGDSVSNKYPDVDIRLTGGPVIAVGNAKQIKTDSIYSVSLAGVLILLLLWIAFRSVRHLTLIAVSIAWGWLFAMGCLSLVHHDVSIIVIGISSVILGIAVNYPLHLIAHLSHTGNADPTLTLEEREVESGGCYHEEKRVDSMRTALKEIVMPLVVGNVTTVGAFLTLVPLNSVALRDLGLFSAFLLVGTIVFVLLWLPHLVNNQSSGRHKTTQNTFERPTKIQNVFERIGTLRLENKPWLVWAVVVLTVVLGYFSLQASFDSDLHNINYMTEAQRQDMEMVESVMQEIDKPEGREPLLMSAIVNNLTDNFNYIGWACACIVFVFLWFSMGSIELALLSFLPMAVSWVWILGLMSLLGVQFNVVNIILATFIFGQGDDYTIFMTEGCQYEYAYRRRMLDSYKYSIIISALIMFIGIGALIIAKHPALHSLAEVTIIGMFSVVLMAWLLPTFIFRRLVYDHGKERLRPITLRNILQSIPIWGKDNSLHHLPFKGRVSAFVSDCYRYRGLEISREVKKNLRNNQKERWQRLIEKNLLPGTTTVLCMNSGWGETAICMALHRPDLRFVVIERDADRRCVARNVAEGRVTNITFVKDMKEEIRTMLEEVLPLVDFDSDFLFAELDSLGVTTIMMTLSDAFGIKLEATDATPRNLKTLDSIVALVEKKLNEKE